MTNHSAYEMLKSLISKKQISAKLLKEFKDYFAEEICSTRQLHYIQSLADLLDVLERRDVFSECDISALHDIAEELDDQNILEAVGAYKKVPVSFENEYAIERILKETEENLKIASKEALLDEPPAAPQFRNSFQAVSLSEKKRKQIQKLVAQEVGLKWRALGRELGLREGEMDELELDYARDSQTRVVKMLEIFERDERNNQRKMVAELCQALVNCRRRDLSSEVQKILTSDRY